MGYIPKRMGDSCRFLYIIWSLQPNMYLNFKYNGEMHNFPDENLYFCCYTPFKVYKWLFYFLIFANFLPILLHSFQLRLGGYRKQHLKWHWKVKNVVFFQNFGRSNSVIPLPMVCLWNSPAAARWPYHTNIYCYQDRGK